MAADKKLVPVRITKPVIAKPFELGYSVGELAYLTEEKAKLVIEEGHGIPEKLPAENAAAPSGEKR